ncbi:MAG TPA: flagellar basal body rod protein FlgC [Candidatus Hydrogenedentes bacterium]|nr:flagellar basal body rod protein FlgC [Candidatus Hydrogenedentota bacterium]HOS03735.1 flagellar basal body rod protein FlgC [Candidatus Hydrogenedentota bacterium]
MEAVSARDIAVSGMRVQRVRMTVSANNIANINTTRTASGGAFRRQLAVLKGSQIRPNMEAEKFGVRVKRVESDPSPLRTVFQPGHPDADADGYVAYPNIDLATEMVDLVSAQRAYEANIAVLASDRRMNQKALEIIQA